MKSLEYMEDKSSSGSGSEDSVCSSSSSSGGAAPTPTFFPSLKTLQLGGLPKLKGWWRNQAEEEATTSLQDQQQQHLNKLPSFPSLSQLTIEDCPNLASMPILQPCLEQLDLRDVSKKVVEEELKMTLVSPTPQTDTLATSSSSSSLLFPPLSSLKSLFLWGIHDLVNLPKESFLSLTSLQNLEICNCPRLTSLSGALRPLTALLSLTIGFCEELDLSDDDNGMQYLRNLTDLSIRSIPKLVSLPVALQHLTTLRTLQITGCADVLNDKCQRGTGEDWPKIAHIPNVHISVYL